MQLLTLKCGNWLLDARDKVIERGAAAACAQDTAVSSSSQHQEPAASSLVRE